MSKSGKNIPVGLKKADKGRHSEKNTSHKDCIYQRMVFTPSGWQGGPKFQLPVVPGCIPADSVNPFRPF